MRVRQRRMVSLRDLIGSTAAYRVGSHVGGHASREKPRGLGGLEHGQACFHLLVKLSPATIPSRRRDLDWYLDLLSGPSS
jgi:hypothetical protein